MCSSDLSSGPGRGPRGCAGSAPAKAAGIPVISFDSGVPSDPTGAVLATATTDNEAAGGNVAKKLAAAPSFQEKVL